MRLCVTGSQGQVAKALKALDGMNGASIHTMSRPDFDLLQPQSCIELLRALRPDVLISAAAFTAVDLAEDKIDDAGAINAKGPGILSEVTSRLGIPIIHLSTDYVFDGTKPTPYKESDRTGPTGIYGATKLAGEAAVAAGNPRHVILRTAWVYSHEGNNFVRTMLRLAETRDRLSVVSDQLGCPTYAVDIADALIDIARNTITAPKGDPKFGVFHMAGGGDTSWAGFATAIFALAKKYRLPDAYVAPISTADYPTRAKRPANSRLDCSQLWTTYGITLPYWHDGLARCMSRLASIPKN